MKKIKYLLFFIPFLFITNVNAWTLGRPYVNYQFANAPFPPGDYGYEQTHYNTPFYISPFLIGGVDYSDYVKAVYFTYYNTNFCSNSDISVSGTLYGGGYQTTNGLFYDESVSVVVKNNGVALSCVLNPSNGQLMNYQCYGKGGGDFSIEFHLNSYNRPNQYYVGISKIVNITCDASNLDVISNATANTNAIINNQNSNTNSIINNQNQNTQSIINSQNSTTNAITSEDNPNTNSSIQGFQNSLASDTPITDLITMPLTLLNAYINGMNSTCTPYNFGSLLGTNLTMPCINLQQRLGNNVWSIIDVLFSIFMIFNISKLFISAFNNFTSLKDDFSNMYTNDYQPKHGGDE